MPAFDFSGIRKTSSPDYGFLVDQLDILRNQLESDGKLSPGDYNLLTKKAQELYSHPGLSPAQRSNVLVKISQFNQEKNVSSQKDLNDISRMNNNSQDDSLKNVMLFGNNPAVLLQANADSLRMKMDQLTQSIEQLNISGNDSSNHINEFNNTLSDYNDVLQALDDMKNHKAGEKPTSNYVAYVMTNSKGEITDVKIGRSGSKTGYAETNGLYGGLQIYGKVNRKESGKNIFVLGNNTFSGSDLTIQDPTTPGAFRSAPLLSSDTSQGKNFGVIPDSYKEIDMNTVRSQSAIRSDGWAKSPGGFLYHRLPNGQYEKYVNTSIDKLGVSENDLINIPSSMEQGIIPSVTKTIDGATPLNLPVFPGTGTGPNISTSTPAVPSATSTPQGNPTSRTINVPTTRAPSGALDIAKNVINKAGGFLKYIFGGPPSVGL